MADNKKNKKVLVKVSKMNEEELDKALDHALDALFGPDEDNIKESKPATKKVPTKKIKPTK